MGRICLQSGFKVIPSKSRRHIISQFKLLLFLGLLNVGILRQCQSIGKYRLGLAPSGVASQKRSTESIFILKFLVYCFFVILGQIMIRRALASRVFENIILGHPRQPHLIELLVLLVKILEIFQSVPCSRFVLTDNVAAIGIQMIEIIPNPVNDQAKARKQGRQQNSQQKTSESKAFHLLIPLVKKLDVILRKIKNIVQFVYRPPLSPPSQSLFYHNSAMQTK